MRAGRQRASSIAPGPLRAALGGEGKPAMKIQGVFLRGRVARRIFAMVVLSALVPALALAVQIGVDLFLVQKSPGSEPSTGPERLS